MTEAGKDAPGGRNPINRELVDQHIKTVNEASIAAIRNLTVLWEARLNLALEADDADALHNALMRSPVAFTDTNCGCGGGGGTAYLG